MNLFLIDFMHAGRGNCRDCISKETYDIEYNKHKHDIQEPKLTEVYMWIFNKKCSLVHSCDIFVKNSNFQKRIDKTSHFKAHDKSKSDFSSMKIQEQNFFRTR